METTRPLILYHDNCADGFTAAWIAWRQFKDAADYLPVQYGEPPPDVAGRNVFILDFSYKRNTLLDMAHHAKSILVLDHHKTAQEELSVPALRHHTWHDDTGHHEIRCVFDIEKSGARLTWEHFHRDEKAPWLVDYTEDRDLWLWKLPGSREVSAALASYERTFDLWEKFSGYSGAQQNHLANEGAAILRYQAQQIDSLVKNASELTIDGYKVLTVNTPVLISEVAGRLAQDRPFGATWFMSKEGKVVWSLRSSPTGIDVSEIAKQHGGGGHAHAAGFTQEGSL